MVILRGWNNSFLERRNRHLVSMLIAMYCKVLIILSSICQAYAAPAAIDGCNKCDG
jgi:hypothetical protein